MMTRGGTLATIGDWLPPADFPMADSRPFVPRWLSIYYHQGQRLGNIGY